VGFEISKFALGMLRDNPERAKIDQKLIFKNLGFLKLGNYSKTLTPFTDKTFYEHCPLLE